MTEVLNAATLTPIVFKLRLRVRISEMVTLTVSRSNMRSVRAHDVSFEQ